MQQSPEPQPLTRLNVTKHDRIWDKENTDWFFGFSSSNTLFSPPLKHITPETAEELWEKFDPLDLLLDSASDRSDSSTNTMIMMTTEEEKRNEESIKNSFLEYELRKTLKISHVSQPGQHYQTQKYNVQSVNFDPNSVLLNGQRTAEDDFITDDGYGTDSRTNTASLSSPLSSSLSSLLTSESSSSQGSMQRNITSNIRPQQISSSGRMFVGNKQNMVVKKRSLPVEKQDNSLMERLRALTTIEEEETFMGDQDRNQPCQNMPQDGERRYGNEFRFSGTRRGNSEFEMDSDSHHIGLYRAVPVNIGSPNNDWNSQDDMHHVQRHSLSQLEYINVHSDHKRYPHSGGVHGVNWTKPGNMFPLNQGGHSRDTPRLSSQGVSAFLNATDESVHTSRNLHQQSNYMYSMPNLSAPVQSENQTVDSWDSDPNNYNVERRIKPDSYNMAPRKCERYSWDCSDTYLAQTKFNNSDSQNFTKRIPSDGDEPPKLSNQFRASSEMSLRSGRPLFATSSDIYKLFQGQGHCGFTQGKQTIHRHSFHAMPSPAWQPGEQATSDVKSRLRAATVSSGHSAADVKSRLRAVSTGASAGRGSVGPLRANHDIYNMNMFASSAKERPVSLLIGNPPRGDNSRLKNTSLKDDDKTLSTLV